ncbi:MAG: CCA tRNA nucleotidyltransferase [Chlamydiota bacterium]|jgi:poly(A) polymerase
MEEHKEARFIVDTLAKHGYVAYYAGGWVRDFLLQKPSDDIDIATSAPPETIQRLFKRTVPIGISFGIILVIIDDKQYEVATFREDIEYKDGRRPTKIAFSTAEQDAQRRDFTINGMFYDPLKDMVIDFVEGKQDLEKKLIKAIGNPHERIKEDRLRMIRAVRLACRFSFAIDPDLKDAIYKHAKELFPAVAIERVVQEFSKMTMYPSFSKAMLVMHELKLLEVIFPKLQEVDLKTLKDRLKTMEDFPRNSPLIVYVNELFANNSIDEAIALCEYLKLSNQEIKFIKFLYEAKHLHQNLQTDDCSWALFYANSLSDLCLHIIGAKIPVSQRAEFFQRHEQRKKELAPFIERIEKQTPLVTANDLIDLGIKPSKKLGELLHEAEKISINKRLLDKTAVLKELQKHFSLN